MHTRLRFLLLISLLLVGVLVLTGCGGGSDSGSAAADDGDSTSADSDDTADSDDGDDAAGEGVTVSAKEFEFDPTSFELPADTATTVTLENVGVVEHDISIEETDVVIYAKPGETTSGEVNLPAGEYVFFCSIPGHRSAGMEGTVTVEG